MNAPEPRAALAEEAGAAAGVPYTVSVRGLCEFAAKHGDLDLRFTPSPSAEDGIAGHREVRARRGDGYRSEVPVLGTHSNLAVRGRADGFDLAQARVEEIKTCLGDTAGMPQNHRSLHWAQAKVYGALLCREFGLPGITVALVYFDVREQRELPPLEAYHTADELGAFFAGLCERFIEWARRETAHRAARDAALERLSFPHPAFRRGQRELAKAVYNAARSSACLLAQAPTGIGKTLATLFPVLKACPRARIDKIAFLTAKGSGKALALDAIEALHRGQPELRLRTVELTAREKACEHPDKACHPESCPLARGFYDRLPGARASAAAQPVLTRETLRSVARAHEVCPYYLALEMTRWSDVVVADYNHWFDRSALVHDLAQENDWRVALLVDEAHNLLDRARAMYSATLEGRRLREALAGAPPRIASSLKRVRKTWNRVVRAAQSVYDVLPEPPEALRLAVRDLTGTCAEHFADQPAAATKPALLDLYFDALALERAIDDFGAHSLFEIRLRGPLPAPGSRSRLDAAMSVRNVVPAPFLGPRFEAAHCAVLFSATLAPWRFQMDTLGLPPTTSYVDIPTPFAPEQLRVRVVPGVSTRYRDRERSIEPIATLVGSEYERLPGNYIVFASSHEYLERLAACFGARFPQVPAWRQTPLMSEDDRIRFLARFVPDGRGVGFAVLGGVFAEGIDLAGTRLVGAFIATLGLPQVNDVNEEMRRRLETLFGCGYDYTYLYPGLRKVVQAAGRVIRTESDRGSVHLIDDRYLRPEVRRLLPSWWRVERAPPESPLRNPGADPDSGGIETGG